MSWVTLATLPTAVVRRRGRFVVADLTGPHMTLSTSAKNGGQAQHVRHLVNHQSCEGSGHDARARAMSGAGQEAYQDVVCAEAGIPADAAAVMGTAANMNYTAVTTVADDDVQAAAVVTAGVQTNATAAGDPARWREAPSGAVQVPETAGTINTMLIVSAPVNPPTLARLAMIITEAKTAALQRLAVPSSASEDLATGTGTDQFAIAAPMDGRWPLTSASPHMKFGEVVGCAVRDATLEALRWQNGLEPSYTRGVFHALGRYGLREAAMFDALAVHLAPDDLELLRRNSRSAFYEPLVGAAAHALAAVLDRARHGTLPPSVLPDAVVQQAATLAAALAAAPDRWPEFRARLHAIDTRDSVSLVVAAIALGWSEKWRSS
jgi:adenosylcobinamide amidohydrolase